MTLCRYCGKALKTYDSLKKMSARAKKLCQDCRYVLSRDEADKWAA